MTTTTPNPLINCKQLAGFINMSVGSVYRLADLDPNFPHYRHGKFRRFVLDEVLDYMGRNNRDKNRNG